MHTHSVSMQVSALAHFASTTSLTQFPAASVEVAPSQLHIPDVLEQSYLPFGGWAPVQTGLLSTKALLYAFLPRHEPPHCAC